MRHPTCVALIPARQGSRRVPGKNVRLIQGKPLIAYTIAAALESDVFELVVVSTDSEEYAAIARRYGACVPCLRPAEYATAVSPDIDWTRWTLAGLKTIGYEYDSFSILRPTSPFRSAATIERAWDRWAEKGTAFDSMRAVEPVRQHPYKAWRYDTTSSALGPIMESAPNFYHDGVPGHSRQYASLPPLYAQNASLEIAWTRTVFERGSIAGERILPFFSEGLEGFDLNTEADWAMMELLIARGEASLPAITRQETRP